MKETEIDRLDILDTIFVPYIDESFVDFIKAHDYGFALIALGACESSAHSFVIDDDVRERLCNRVSDIIDEYVDLKLQEREQDRINRYVDSCPRPLAGGGFKNILTGEYIPPEDEPPKEEL